MPVNPLESALQKKVGDGAFAFPALLTTHHSLPNLLNYPLSVIATAPLAKDSGGFRPSPGVP
jgi:hypothetical protein